MARHLAAAREAIGKSQGQVEIATGVHRQQISNWERRQIPSTWIKLFALASYYGVSLDWLFGIVDRTASAAHDGRSVLISERQIVYEVPTLADARIAQELLDILAELDPDDQRILLRIAERLSTEHVPRIIE